MEDPAGENTYQCLLPKQRISLLRIAPVTISCVGGRSLEQPQAKHTG